MEGKYGLGTVLYMSSYLMTTQLLVVTTSVAHFLSNAHDELADVDCHLGVTVL